MGRIRASSTGSRSWRYEFGVILCVRQRRKTPSTLLQREKGDPAIRAAELRASPLPPHPQRMRQAKASSPRRACWEKGRSEGELFNAPPFSITRFETEIACQTRCPGSTARLRL